MEHLAAEETPGKKKKKRKSFDAAVNLTDKLVLETIRTIGWNTIF